MKNRYQARLPATTSAPKSVVFQPLSQHIGSFEVGQQLLLNRYEFAGQIVEASGWSIWETEIPNAKFEAALHEFTWLDDLSAVGNTRARVQAQEWVLEWVQNYGTGNGAGWAPALTGHRLSQQLIHAGFLLKGMKPKDVARWLGSLGRQADYLARQWKSETVGLARFIALAGLVFADVVLEGRVKNLPKTMSALGKACKACIDEGGGVASRNPQELAEIFAILVRVHAVLSDSGYPPDQRLDRTLGRAAPTLRGLRLGDGGLVRFYGGGRGAEGQLDQALIDANLTDRSTNDSPMGFARMVARKMVVIADVAKPRQGAHSSALGFEMSVGRQPVIVNYGAETNTLKLGGAVSLPPKTVNCDRASDITGVWMLATHDGYAPQWHERRMFARADGRMLSGEDSLKDETGLEAARREIPWSLHFHIHRDINPEIDSRNRSVTLTLPNGETWSFRQEGGLLKLAEGQAATKQIVVISRAVNYTGRIIWSFSRSDDQNR